MLWFVNALFTNCVKHADLLSRSHLFSQLFSFAWRSLQCRFENENVFFCFEYFYSFFLQMTFMWNWYPLCVRPTEELSKIDSNSEDHIHARTHHHSECPQFIEWKAGHQHFHPTLTPTHTQHHNHWWMRPCGGSLFIARGIEFKGQCPVRLYGAFWCENRKVENPNQLVDPSKGTKSCSPTGLRCRSEQIVRVELGVLGRMGVRLESYVIPKLVIWVVKKIWSCLWAETFGNYCTGNL